MTSVWGLVVHYEFMIKLRLN